MREKSRVPEWEQAQAKNSFAPDDSLAFLLVLYTGSAWIHPTTLPRMRTASASTVSVG